MEFVGERLAAGDAPLEVATELCHAANLPQNTAGDNVSLVLAVLKDAALHPHQPHHHQHHRHHGHAAEPAASSTGAPASRG